MIYQPRKTTLDQISKQREENQTLSSTFDVFSWPKLAYSRLSVVYDERKKNSEREKQQGRTKARKGGERQYCQINQSEGIAAPAIPEEGR